MKIIQKHGLLGWFLLVIALIILLIHSLLLDIIPNWVLSILSSLAAALIAVAIAELLFKTFLQTDLIDGVVRIFKNSINLPVQSVYLQRSSLPLNQDPKEIIRSAKSEVYVKGISFAKLVADGFVQDLSRDFKGEKVPSVRFMILNPSFKAFDDVALLTGLAPSMLKENIGQFTKQIDAAASEGLRIEYAYYSSSPSIGLWLVDPDLETGWCRIELYLYHGEPQSSRSNIIIRKRDAPDFFERLWQNIKKEWESNFNPREFNSQSILVRQQPKENKQELQVIQAPVKTNDDLEISKADRSDTSPYLFCISFSSTNLKELKDFYKKHDPLASAGFRGADSIPPRTDNGIFRVINPEKPEQKMDIILPRPTGFVYDNESNRFIVACQATNDIIEISEHGVKQLLSHNMFNHLHSIDYFDDKLAIACSGTDTVLLFNLKKKQLIFSWLAIKNGYNKCPDGSTRKLFSNVDYRTSLFPTLQQSTHVNSVVISRRDPTILYASLFHQGEIVRIDTSSVKTSTQISGLTHPHGLKSDGNGGYVLSQASTGRIHILDSGFRRTDTYFDPEVQWLQDVCGISPKKYAYTDVYGAKLKILDLPSHSVNYELDYENNLKVYQLRTLSDKRINDFKWLSEICTDKSIL